MKKTFFILIFVLTLLAGFIVAERFLEIELSKGKNEIRFNISGVYASDLIKFYPEIETITYREENETIGFVNIFGGIGVNFMLESNRTYEINSNKNITIYLK